jgi:acyl-CoA synthetase (AMP-forming)/AMP-acid ligase II
VNDNKRAAGNRRRLAATSSRSRGGNRRNAGRALGEAPHAFVVLKAGATATETELRNYARDHLAHFKCPQRIQFVSELPKTATGKVQKYVLRGKPAISKQ